VRRGKQTAVAMIAASTTVIVGCGGSDDGDAPKQVVPQQVEPLPLDGGSYTWEETGITMTLSVIKTEPWGTRDDYCGDGSCGVSNPDDLRWVLKYEVAVPESRPNPFNVGAQTMMENGCPGSLHIVSGNDDASIIGVAGDYASDLEGIIMPGATKYGVQEYSIEKSAIGQEFYIQSSCGGRGTVTFQDVIDSSKEDQPSYETPEDVAEAIGATNIQDATDRPQRGREVSAVWRGHEISVWMPFEPADVAYARRILNSGEYDYHYVEGDGWFIIADSQQVANAAARAAED
jgi:hypothetical protein